MAQTFYLAKNKKEYLTASDAEIKGGGLVGRRTPMGELREKLSLTKAEKEEIKNRKGYETNEAVRYEVNGTFDQVHEVEVEAMKETKALPSDGIEVEITSTPIDKKAAAK